MDIWRLGRQGGNPTVIIQIVTVLFPPIVHSLQTPIHKGEAALGRYPYGWVSGGCVGKEGTPTVAIEITTVAI